jgi:hypothetical protein
LILLSKRMMEDEAAREAALAAMADEIRARIATPAKACLSLADVLDEPRGSRERPAADRPHSPY